MPILHPPCFVVSAMFLILVLKVSYSVGFCLKWMIVFEVGDLMSLWQNQQKLDGCLQPQTTPGETPTMAAMATRSLSVVGRWECGRGRGGCWCNKVHENFRSFIFKQKTENSTQSLLTQALVNGRTTRCTL